MSLQVRLQLRYFIHFDLGELTQVFEVFAAVVDCRMVMDSTTGKNKGYSFVELSTPADAEKVVTEEITLDGQKVSTNSRAVSNVFYQLSLQKAKY